MALEDRLHTNMMGRGNIVRGHKESAQIFRDLREVLNGPLLSDFPSHIIKGKPPGMRLLEECGMQAFHSYAIQDGTDDADSVEGLDAG